MELWQNDHPAIHISNIQVVLEMAVELDYFSCMAIIELFYRLCGIPDGVLSVGIAV